MPRLAPTFAAALTVAGAVFPAWVDAAVISLNITGAAEGSTLDSGDVVGVVPAAYWNNTANPGGQSSQTINGLLDSTGAVTGVTAAISGGAYSYSNLTLGSPHAAPYADDSVMMGTALGMSGSGAGRAAYFSGVPYAVYDVYVYFGGANASATTPYTMPVSYEVDLGEGYTAVGDTIYMRDADNRWDGEYDEAIATAADAAVDGKEYVVFRGMTASSFRVYTGSVGRRAGLSGIQIVEVPEPASVVLAGGGLLLLLPRRRRR